MTSTGPKLLDQVRHRLRTKRYALRTEETYLNWIRRFILFHSLLLEARNAGSTSRTLRASRALIRRNLAGLEFLNLHTC